MTGPVAKVARIENDRAELAIPKEVAERAGLKANEELLLFSPGGNVLLLAREMGKKGFFVGSLETLSVPEIFGFVTATIRSGTLVLQSPTQRRRIVFQDGQVVAASSTDLSERLGPVIWRYGLVSAERLAECEPRVSAQVKLGACLVTAGYLTPAQLYRGVQLQTKEIVLGAFLEAEGEFAFIEGDTSEGNSLRLQVRTRDLVLEGIKRGERLTQLRQTFDPAASVRRAEGAPAAPEGIEQKAVYDRIDGTRSVRDLIRLSKLGEYAALDAISKLVATGLVTVQQPPASAPARAASARAPGPGLPDLLQQALRRIADEMRAVGALSRLDSFFSELPPHHQKLFEGVRRGPADLDLAALHANAQTVAPGAMGRALALEALDAFFSFALFDARNVLPAGKAADLSRELTRMLRNR